MDENFSPTTVEMQPLMLWPAFCARSVGAAAKRTHGQARVGGLLGADARDARVVVVNWRRSALTEARSGQRTAEAECG